MATVKVPPTHDFHVDLKLSCLYGFMTELCRLKAEAIQYHRIKTFTDLDNGKSRSEIGGLNLAAGKVTIDTCQRLPLCLECKFCQEQVTKAHRGNRGIALFIL